MLLLLWLLLPFSLFLFVFTVAIPSRFCSYLAFFYNTGAAVDI